MIEILFEVDDEDKNETLIACLPVMMMKSCRRTAPGPNMD